MSETIHNETMSATTEYTRTEQGWVRTVAAAPAGYHRTDRPGLPVAWWRVNPRYTLYMLRELSSIFNALWALRVLLQFRQAHGSREGYDRFVAAQRRPAWIAYHLITLLFALIHSVTFLIAAGKGPTVHVRGRRVPERTLATGAFAGWAAASLAVALALLLGGHDADTA